MSFEVNFTRIAAVGFGKTAIDYTSCFCTASNINFLFLGDSFCGANNFCLISHCLAKISFFLDLFDRICHVATWNLSQPSSKFVEFVCHHHSDFCGCEMNQGWTACSGSDSCLLFECHF